MKKEMLRLERLAANDLTGLLREGELCLYEGELLGLAGLSDSGLRDLVAAITGSAPAAAGTVWVEGRPVRIPSPRQAYALGIRHLRGDVPLNHTLTIAENMFLTTYSAKRPFLLSYQKMNAQCRRYLEMVELDVDPATRAGELTPIQQGLVMLAKTAYEDGRIIVLDNLLPLYTVCEFAQILRIIRKMTRKGVSFLMVAYALQSSFFEADRAVVMRKGYTAGTVDRPKEAYQRLYRMLLGEVGHKR